MTDQDTAAAVPAPGAHGGDGAAVAAALGLDSGKVLDLSLSLNPVAPDPAPVVAEHLDSLGRYPDTGTARRVLAAHIGLEADRLLLTSGGSEAISLVAAELGGRVVEPEFSAHPRVGDDTALLWRSNPHNPSGLLAAKTERAGVWDEAFYPLATGHWTRGDEGTVVVGSLTKLLACPGLRIGYVIADPALIDALGMRQPEWSVNSLATSALPDLLEQVDLESWSRSVTQLRGELVALLRAHGLLAGPSDANWVLVEAPGLRERLAPHGVLVRDCSSFGLEGVVRIAVPSADGLARLDEALSALSLASVKRDE